MRFLDWLVEQWEFPAEDNPRTRIGEQHPPKGRHDEEHWDLTDPPASDVPGDSGSGWEHF